MMNCPCDDFFPRAAFPSDQNRGIRGGNLLRLSKESSNAFTREHNLEAEILTLVATDIHDKWDREPSAGLCSYNNNY